MFGVDWQIEPVQWLYIALDSVPFMLVAFCIASCAFVFYFFCQAILLLYIAKIIRWVTKK